MENTTVDQLALEATRARREERFTDARRHAEDAVALCRQVGRNRKLVRALMLLGQIERDTAQGERALELYEEAAAVSREVDRPLRVAHTVRHLGDLLRELGKLAPAEHCYKESLDIYRGEKDTSAGDLANAIRGFALLKDSAGAANEARALWDEARTLYGAARN